jgi:hypothetical protein
VTVLEFPQVPGSLHASGDSEAKRQARDFCELENSLCDASPRHRSRRANSRADGELIFAVCHVSEMVAKLKADYYAAYNGTTAVDE